MQYKTVFVCMLNIKFIHFNSLFKASYIKQKHLTEFLYLIQQRYYRERREKVGNMSSLNSWLIFVTLLFKSFFYQSSFAGYNSSYPPSGEFLHQVNLFHLHQIDRVFCFHWKARALNKLNKNFSVAVIFQNEKELINYIPFGLDINA